MMVSDVFPLKYKYNAQTVLHRFPITPFLGLASSHFVVELHSNIYQYSESFNTSKTVEKVECVCQNGVVRIYSLIHGSGHWKYLGMWVSDMSLV
jgi:hypothetical protein